MNVRVFAGHRECSVNCVATNNNKNEKFIADFTSCDEKGFVATWDIRSPKRMSNVSIPFLTTLINKNKTNKSKNSGDDDETIEITEIVNTNEFFTIALSEEYIAMIDWRKPRTPVWTYSSTSAASPFSCLLASSDELFIFHEEGAVSVLDPLSGTFRRSAPSTLSERQEMQLPCGVGSNDSQNDDNNNNGGGRFAIVASTFGHVSLLDLQTWNIVGSVLLGGMKDEASQENCEEASQNKTTIEKMTNPPLLASLSCQVSPFVVGGTSKDNKDDEDEDEKIMKNNYSHSVTGVSALVSRADGVIAFAHAQANTHPAVTRCADITATDLSHSLCSANWIRSSSSSSSSALISCVGVNGVVSLWQVPNSAFRVPEDDDENENENEDNEDEPIQLSSVNLMADPNKYSANDAQKKSVKDGDAEMNCACVISKNNALVVGDTAGRILWIDIES